MHFNKAFCAHFELQEGNICSETFEILLQQLNQLPADVRGAKALEMSAVLVELAAYDLANKLDSAEIGKLIHRSVELSERSLELKEAKPLRPRAMVPALQ